MNGKPEVIRFRLSLRMHLRPARWCYAGNLWRWHTECQAIHGPVTRIRNHHRACSGGSTVRRRNQRLSKSNRQRLAIIGKFSSTSINGHRTHLDIRRIKVKRPYWHADRCHGQRLRAGESTARHVLKAERQLHALKLHLRIWRKVSMIAPIGRIKGTALSIAGSSGWSMPLISLKPMRQATTLFFHGGNRACPCDWCRGEQ